LDYAAVLKSNDHIMPVAEFISTDQSTTATSSWLYAFKLFATERGFDMTDYHSDADCERIFSKVNLI